MNSEGNAFSVGAILHCKWEWFNNVNTAEKSESEGSYVHCYYLFIWGSRSPFSNSSHLLATVTLSLWFCVFWQWSCCEVQHALFLTFAQDLWYRCTDQSRKVSSPAKWVCGGLKIRQTVDVYELEQLYHRCLSFHQSLLCLCLSNYVSLEHLPLTLGLSRALLYPLVGNQTCARKQSRPHTHTHSPFGSWKKPVSVQLSLSGGN